MLAATKGTFDPTQNSCPGPVWRSWVAPFNRTVKRVKSYPHLTYCTALNANSQKVQEASGDGNQASYGVSQTPSQRNVRSGIRSGSAAGLRFVAVRDVPFGIACLGSAVCQVVDYGKPSACRRAPKTLPATDLLLGRLSKSEALFVR
ncbi:hypothetical protein QQF64_023437 [Cirrhinus molitorella]|uniref:Uncharacterized protein n=1 Tax=Cirrhinus molitorella TaxID=172907 RepID=A0ABR3L574_9TELE